MTSELNGNKAGNDALEQTLKTRRRDVCYGWKKNQSKDDLHDRVLGVKLKPRPSRTIRLSRLFT